MKREKKERGWCRVSCLSADSSSACWFPFAVPTGSKSSKPLGCGVQTLKSITASGVPWDLNTQVQIPGGVRTQHPPFCQLLQYLVSLWNEHRAKVISAQFALQTNAVSRPVQNYVSAAFSDIIQHHKATVLSYPVGSKQLYVGQWLCTHTTVHPFQQVMWRTLPVTLLRHCLIRSSIIHHHCHIHG